MLLDIDAQGSEGLPGLTKLGAEGIRAVRKMSGGYDEDQVTETGETGEGDSILHDQVEEEKSDQME